MNLEDLLESELFNMISTNNLKPSENKLSES